MNCNNITKPPFTKEQIAECQSCKWISKKKRWCCLFGVWIIEEGKILQPIRKIIQPKLPPIQKMAGNFAKSAFKYAASGLKNRSPKEQETCKQICRKCENYMPESKLGERCKKCGCCINLAVRWVSKNCPIGKW